MGLCLSKLQAACEADTAQYYYLRARLRQYFSDEQSVDAVLRICGVTSQVLQIFDSIFSKIQQLDPRFQLNQKIGFPQFQLFELSSVPIFPCPLHYPFMWSIRMRFFIILLMSTSLF
jgi:hypothetical protein